MDITTLFFTRREDSLLSGDYNNYRAQTSRRLHTVRKKLGRTTPKGRKYNGQAPISPEDVGTKAEFAHLLVLSAERAWAHAMHMKATHSADPSNKGVVGPTRRHIITRLNKASKYAEQLVSVLQKQSLSGASDTNLLEARAYLALLSGALFTEKQRWDRCLRYFSEARIIYTALGQKEKKEAYRDLISATIDPSLRYAAYQLRLPRNKPLPSLAIENFPDNKEIRAEVEKLDATCLTENAAGTTKLADGEVQQLPESITWRSRSVPIEDASIAQALAAASAAEAKLASYLSERPSASAKEKAAAYDTLIQASQEAVDATKTTLDDLSNEGVEQGDRRIQALQVIRTAVNYSLIGWRVGRNRVLSGEGDGLFLDTEQGKSDRRHTSTRSSNSKILSQLREKVALYDSTLQSLDFIRELPGVAGDSEFVTELEVKRDYFRALRCLAIGRSHSSQGNVENALALFSRASELATATLSNKMGTTASDGPTKLDISPERIQSLAETSEGLVAQHRGLVTLNKLSETKHDAATSQLPLIQRMDEYTAQGLDTNNLVPFPPKMQPVAVKPIFLDVAWNYIQYPREGKQQGAEKVPAEEEKGGRRGWFGFGR
ncbi:putative signal recognition particle [Talaromyces proteolyticus]|uniref:Signal recognition particle subunit SRP68 n=1 Tax=Talaromyces proteolyticus TaxID=1131652 RepID=A0AAD4KUX4_9EURO|nr:putative signal recognition particle [Talaromyces proteolyticus]KAH8700449.1 putative signal recognition particle [Talaromyces proteolyticus]